MRFGEVFAQLGSVIAALMFMKAIAEQYLPNQLRNSIAKHTQKLFSFLSPYIQITFNEFTGERFMRSEAYSVIETYLSSTSSAQARRLKADTVKNSSQVVSLSMDDNEEVADEYRGVKVWWASGKQVSKNQTFSFQPVHNDEKRYYTLRFHKKHRSFITETYLIHVLKRGKEIKVKNRQRKLYTNNGPSWNHVQFEHPATFQKLLYGPPGTGKSTLIAAMANLLEYDLYDLELTAVKDNTELKKLLIATSSKAVIVIEDIDCSADLTGQRGKRPEKKDEDDKDVLHRMVREETDSKSSKITLSGLLNFIDGLWSACGGERIIVFTTNYVERLDP